MKKDDTKMVTARLPAALVKQLDRAAQRSNRSRTREMVVQLKAGLSRTGTRSAA
ncbi:hypothetical protein [Polaromonas sp.]|uniref:hypothetical protein n=1 Tax=Polaromonas sp. TaxID=1869339 RepID=UPI00272F305B|nr:hypothetical protein [Polaromonas sp.]MDP1886631.1 hypothetical protein [Polaromonas sp.]